MAENAELRALNPQTWFPVLKPQLSDKSKADAAFPVDIRPMFYFPKFAKSLDGKWMAQCVGRWLDSLPGEATRSVILDAHFGYPEGVGCYLTGKSRGLPVFVTIRGLEVELFSHATIGPQLIEALQHVSGVIAVSHSLREAAIAAGVPAERIAVIPNGIEADTFYPGDRCDARRKLGLSDATRLIVCVANLKHVKGHDNLIRAVAKLPSKSHVRLVCIGESSDPKWTAHLKQMVSEMGLDKVVSFLGAKEPSEVVDWLRASNVFALASRREGCCNAVLESLASGTPVVATRVGDNADFVAEGQAGYLSASGDVVTLSNNLATALQQSWCSDRIRESVKDRTWSYVGKDVLAFMHAQSAKPVPDRAKRKTTFIEGSLQAAEGKS